MTIKATTSIKRDGDSWWVDDPRAEQIITGKKDESDKILNPIIQSSQYDAEGYDKDGFNREGFNKYSEKHRDTGTEYDSSGYNTLGFNAQKTHKVTFHGFDPAGYNAEGYNRAGYDRNGNYNVTFDKNSKENRHFSGGSFVSSGDNRGHDSWRDDCH